MKKLSLILSIITVLLLAVILGSCGKTELDSPENIKYDGNTITWNDVDGAESYTVKINGGSSATVRDNKFSYDALGKDFSVSITAESSAKKIIASKSASVSFKALDKINEIRFSDSGAASWDVVNKASGYKVRIDGVEIDKVLTATEYSEIGTGRHSVQVKPVNNGDSTYYSVWSDAETITVLDAVSKNDITYSDGYIKWKYVSGAQYYVVAVNGVAITDSCTATQIAYDPKNQDFEVSVKAIGNHTDTFDGVFSEKRSFVFLDTVTNIYIDDGIVKWDAVNGADGYKLKLNGAIYSQVLTDCYFDKLTANVTTDIQILPISNDNAYFSDWSATKSALVLPAPVLQWNNDYDTDGADATSNIFWDGIANASGYSVKIIYPDGTETISTMGETQRFFQESYTAIGTYKIYAKALAATSSVNSYDSMYSIPITVVRLDSPTPVDKDYITSNPLNLNNGFTVTFNKVTGATQYNLYKDNVIVKSATSNQFTVSDLSDNASIEEQTYNFKIQSVGTVKKVNGEIVATLNSIVDTSMSFSVKVLATPTMPDISGFTYTFGSVNNAFGYVVDIGGQSFTSDEATYDLSILEAGVYEVTVCAKGNGAEILSSNYSYPISVNRLEAPRNVRIDTSEASEGVLAYDTVQNATGYTVVFNNNGIAVPVNTISNMNQYITEQGTTVYMQSTANYYNDTKTIYYMTSQPGTTNNFIKLSRPTFGDVAFSSSQLIWKAPSNINASVYTPTYEVFSPTGEIYNGEKNGTTMDISYLEGGRSYEFLVKAIGNGTNYINSEKSTPVTIYKLSSPLVTVKEGKYTWSGVINAVSYAVYIDGVLMETYTHESGASYSYTPDFDELKTYKVEIFAVGDGGYTSINSDPAIILQETKQLETPDFSVSYSEAVYSDNGKVTVNVTREAPYANGYAYTIGGVTYTSSESTYSHRPSSVGTITVTVYALGGKFDENGVYYLDSQSRGGNSRYSLTLLASPNPSSFKLSMEGYLSWTAISGTSKYEIQISVNGAEYTDWTTIDSPNTTIENYSEIETLSVRIRAKGNGNDVITSEYAEYTWTL